MASHKVHPLVALGIAGGSLAGGYLLGKRRLRTSIPSPPTMTLTLTVGDVVIVKKIVPGNVILETVESLLKYVNDKEKNVRNIEFSVGNVPILQIENRRAYLTFFDIGDAWIRVAIPEAWQTFTTQKSMEGSLTIETTNHRGKTTRATLTLLRANDSVDDPFLLA
jgi:hypothetical protein